MNIKKGLIRLWIAVSLCWIFLISAIAYDEHAKAIWEANKSLSNIVAESYLPGVRSRQAFPGASEEICLVVTYGTSPTLTTIYCDLPKSLLRGYNPYLDLVPEEEKYQKKGLTTQELFDLTRLHKEQKSSGKLLGLNAEEVRDYLTRVETARRADRTKNFVLIITFGGLLPVVLVFAAGLLGRLIYRGFRDS